MRLSQIFILVSLLAEAHATGRGPFADSEIIDSFDTAPAMVRGDVNGNGRMDVVITDRAGGQLLWLENTPGGWVQHLVANAAGIDSVAVGDLDRDGKLDIVASSASLNVIRWFRNELGDGSSWVGALVTNSAADVGAITVADLDRDGRLDIVAAVRGTEQIRFWRQGALAWSERTVVGNVADVRELAVADINRDGRPDIVALVGGADAVYWWAGPADIGGTTPWTSQFVGGLLDPVGLAVLNFDHAGGLDILAASRSNRQVSLWRGDGSGAVGSWQQTLIGQLSGPSPIEALQVLELDRDNSLDVLVAADGVLGWFDHDLASGSFSWRDISTGTVGRSLLAFDIDRDGDKDILLGAADGDVLQFYNRAPRQRPAFDPARFQVASGGHQGNLGASNPQVLLIDLIANGRPDIASWVDRSDDFQFPYSSAWWWRNHPVDIAPATSAFVPPGSAWPFTGMASADFSGNGHIDLLFGVGTQLIQTFHLCEHLDGFGESWDCRPQQDDGNLGVTLSIGGPMVYGDINRNGRTDVVAITTTSPVFGSLPPTLVWFENRGTGGSSDNWRAHEIAQTGAAPVALIDISGNARLDIVLADGSIWLNGNNGASWTLVDTGVSLGLVRAVGDIDGDGRPDLLLNDGWAGFNGVAWVEFPLDPAPGGSLGRTWLTDLDGDGDLDVVSVAGSQAEASVHWLENRLDQGLSWRAEALFDFTEPFSGGALETIYALDLLDSDLPELAVRFGQFDYLFSNQGASLGVRLEDTAPGGVLEGQASEVAQLQLNHWGRPGDRDIAVRRLRLGFADTAIEAGPTLNQAEVNQLLGSLSLWNGNVLLAEISSPVVDALGYFEIDLGPARPDTAVPCCDQTQSWRIELTPRAGAAAAFPAAVFLIRGDLDAVDLIDDHPVSAQGFTRFVDIARIQPISAPAGQFALAVRASPGGRLSSSPGDIACDGDAIASGSPDCHDFFTSGTQVTVVATTDPGFELAAWSGACSGSGSCVVTMNGHRSVRADFVPADITAVETLVMSAGSVSSSNRVTSLPAGINCPGGQCSADFPVGQTVTLSALPGPGQVFDRWTSLQNLCQPINHPVCSFTMLQTTAGTTNMGAVFQTSSETRTITVSPLGQGRILGDIPPAINCPGQCSRTYLINTLITLTAAPEPGWLFTGWQGGGCSGTGPCSVRIDQHQTITATFTEAPVSLALAISRIGQGRVTSQPVGIDCGNSCTVGFEQGTALSLTAIPDPGWAFVGWQADACGGSGSCDFTLTETTEVTAEFEYLTTQYTLEITLDGPGSVVSQPSPFISCSSSCTRLIDENTVIELAALPNPGYQFAGWSGACSGTGTCLLTLSGNRQVTAQFVAVAAEYSLTVNRVGVGFVSSAPSGIRCGQACQANYLDGTAVTLSAATPPGWRFLDWQGACSGSDPFCEVDMGQDQTATARFEPTVTLTILIDGEGRVDSADGSIDCGEFCSSVQAPNSAVSLTATPAPGWQIDQWAFAASGCGNSPTCLVSMGTQNRTAAVRFVEIPPPPQFNLTVTRSGQGTVASSPVGILCGDDCSSSFAENATVTLTATPDTYWRFVGWVPAGLGCGSAPQCTVTMSQNRNVGAQFVEAVPELTITPTLLNFGEVPVGNSVNSLLVTLANPGSGPLEVAGIDAAALPFEDDGGTCPQPPFSLDPGAECVREYRFSPDAPGLYEQIIAVGSNAPPGSTSTYSLRGVGISTTRTLTVHRSGEGLITSDPAGIDCGPSCQAEFDQGSQVILTAQAGPGSVLISWTGAAGSCGDATECPILLDQDRTVGVLFQSVDDAIFADRFQQ